MIPKLPGFQDTVHDAQRSFRNILAGFSRPGQVQPVAVDLSPPPGLMVATAATGLTLLDLEVTIWLPEALPQASRDWLLFHTGVRVTADRAAADFALVHDMNHCPDLADFWVGTPEYPEASTTLLLQVPSLTAGESVSLQGPGIQGEIAIAPQVPPRFWCQWSHNQGQYPLGIDVLLLCDRQLMGLPRTARLQHPMPAPS